RTDARLAAGSNSRRAAAARPPWSADAAQNRARLSSCVSPAPAHAGGRCRIARRGRLDVDAVQHLMEQQSVDAAPHAAQLVRRRVPQLADIDDAGTVQPLLHAPSDAVDFLQV